MPAAIGAAPGAKEKTRLGGIFQSSGLREDRGLRDQMRRPEIVSDMACSAHTKHSWNS
jgi:hypothetical protein